MKRLTEKDKDNNYKIQGKNLDYHCTSKDKQGYVTYRGEHIDKLGEIEDLEEFIQSYCDVTAISILRDFASNYKGYKEKFLTKQNSNE